MNYFDQESESARLDEQRRRDDLSNSRADVPREYRKTEPIMLVTMTPTGIKVDVRSEP